MDSRESFEKYCINHCACDLSKDTTGAYRSMTTKRLWRFWQASRAAIEIKIDNHDEFEIEHMTSCPDGYAKGWIDGRNYAAKQVRAAGITVKGE